MSADKVTDEKRDDSEEEPGKTGGVGGTLVAVANSKPVSALLGPAFTALGGYWGERTEEIVEQWRLKRKRNIEAQVEKVVQIDGPPPEVPTEEQVLLSRAWEEAAQHIDPDEESELAMLWQGLLGRIFRDKRSSRDLLSALEGLGSRDAAVLLKMSDSWELPPAGDEQAVETLVERRLAEPFKAHYALRPLGKPVAFPSFQIVTLCLLASVGSWLAASSLSMRSTSSTILMAQDILFVFAILCLIMAGMVAFRAASYALRRIGTVRLTRLGVELKASGLKYAPRDKSTS